MSELDITMRKMSININIKLHITNIKTINMLKLRSYIYISRKHLSD